MSPSAKKSTKRTTTRSKAAAPSAAGFTAEELEALVLGARWVEGRQDGALSRAAGLALAKIAAASPDELKQRIDEAGLWPVTALITT